MFTYVPNCTNVQTYIHAYIHTYIHIYITYVQTYYTISIPYYTYINTYVRTNILYYRYTILCIHTHTSLLVINTYLHSYGLGQLEFIEIFLNTLAAHNNLTVVNPPELSTIVHRHNWVCDEMIAHSRNRSHPWKNNWYHPVKQKFKCIDPNFNFD